LTAKTIPFVQWLGLHSIRIIALAICREGKTYESTLQKNQSGALASLMTAENVGGEELTFMGPESSPDALEGERSDIILCCQVDD
jgi:hypothetical protein